MRSRLSLRARITAVATLAVAVAVGLGGVLFLFVLSTTLFDSAASAAENEADRFQQIVQDSGPAALQELDGYAQLIADGRVVASTEDLEDAPALASDELDDPVAASVPGEDDRLVIATTDVDDDLLVAGVADDGRDEAIATTGVLLLVAVPVIVLFVGLTCWVVVGRALRPVERMRAAAERVTAADLAQRIDAPAGGDEVGRLGATLNRMLDRLQDAQTRQRRFVSDASHELRSPVSSLQQNAEIAQHYPGRIPPASFAATVAEESARMAGLIDGLLLLARADEATLRPVLRPVDLDDLALREVRRLRGGELKIDGSAIAAARASADEALLGRALRNLVDNAARHARSRVAIASAVVGEEVVLAVEDDGSGIAPSERERVFERFVRLDESRSRDAGGSGLGLAIVAEIAHAHGGSVSVGDSRLGGARFEIRLPSGG
ncbi:HAMP domain-containing protein [Microbacteriaceae bacterium VKM Ac-2854]|nr:HAMP domain-containing protein [Microbacteriaceae bacterium VKM Ac-2854]